MTRRCSTCLVVLFVLTLGRPLLAASDEVRTVVLMRALAYDEALTARAGGQVVLALVTAKGVDAPIRASLKGLAKVTIRGLPISVIEITYDDAGTLATTLKAGQVSVVFLAAGLERDLPSILGVTRALKVRSVTGEATYLKKGVSLGAVDVAGSDKPRLMVNVDASQLEGMQLSSQLLQVAQKIE